MRELRSYSMGIIAILAGIYMWTVGLPDNQTSYFLIPIIMGTVVGGYLWTDLEYNKKQLTLQFDERLNNQIRDKKPATKEDIAFIEARTKELDAEEKLLREKRYSR